MATRDVRVRVSSKMDYVGMKELENFRDIFPLGQFVLIDAEETRDRHGRSYEPTFGVWKDQHALSAHRVTGEKGFFLEQNDREWLAEWNKKSPGYLARISGYEDIAWNNTGCTLVVTIFTAEDFKELNRDLDVKNIAGWVWENKWAVLIYGGLFLFFANAQCSSY